MIRDLQSSGSAIRGSGPRRFCVEDSNRVLLKGRGAQGIGYGAMAEYKRGSMDVSTHQKTYGGFLRISAWVVWFVLFILVFLALFNS